MINTLFIIKDNIEIHKGLAFEQVLFLHQNTINNPENLSTVCIWSSLPAVVIGRNQNPFIESNIPFNTAHNISLARRNSGGGTVYQDIHNVNFCFITPRNIENLKTHGLSIVVNTLKTLGISCSIDDNNNIRYNGDKISGSAYRYSNSYQFHHFTLLLSSDLEVLNKAIHPTHNMEVQSIGVTSKRTSVTNLQIKKETVIDAFIAHCNISHDDICIYDEQQAIKHNETTFMREYHRFIQDTWIYGHTPRFSIMVPLDGHAYKVIVQKGQITKIIDTQGHTTWSGAVALYDNPLDTIACIDNNIVQKIIRTIYHSFFGTRYT